MTVAALRRGRSSADEEEAISRLLQCSRCHELVRVYEVPGPFIEEHAFVCGECLTRKPGAGAT